MPLTKAAALHFITMLAVATIMANNNTWPRQAGPTHISAQSLLRALYPQTKRDSSYDVTAAHGHHGNNMANASYKAQIRQPQDAVYNEAITDNDRPVTFNLEGTVTPAVSYAHLRLNVNVTRWAETCSKITEKIRNMESPADMHRITKTKRYLTAKLERTCEIGRAHV